MNIKQRASPESGRHLQAAADRSAVHSQVPEGGPPSLADQLHESPRMLAQRRQLAANFGSNGYAPGSIGAVLQRVVVYRMGTSTDTNLCPRNPQDLDGGGRGLSTNTDPGNGKAQIIETGSLGASLEAVNDHGTHYAIRPPNDADKALLTAWANARGSPHALTSVVRAARTGTRSAAGVVGDPD